MGYRLEISKIKYTGVCGGKLYGYTDDETLHKMKSYEWLKKNEYIEGDECWGYGFNPQIVLNKEDFIEFVKLYNEDLNNFYDCYNEKDWFINNEEIIKLMNDDSKKILEWG